MLEAEVRKLQHLLAHGASELNGVKSTGEVC